MKVHARKSKGFTEIYFVLYLSALILLIPDKDPEEVIGGIPNQSINAFIKSERSSLSVKLQADTSGSRIISSDSVNVIYPVGNVKNVKYSFSIMSQNVKRTIWTSDKDDIDENANFRIEKLNDNSIKFIWKPSNFNFTNQNYTVLAEAEINTKDSTNPFPVYSKTQFNLNMFYVDQIPVLASGNERTDAQTIDRPNDQPQTLVIQAPSGSLSALPKESKVMNLAYKTWTDDSFIFGADIKKDLQGIPKISVRSEDPSASAEILDYSESRLVLKGKTPGYGEMRVSVEVTRKSDRETAIAQFSVKPIPLEEPKIPNVMYPERTYLIRPNLPQLDPQNEKAYIKTDREVLAFLKENQSTFEFIPQYEDISKDLYFERMINDNPLESKVRIKVIDYPSPEFVTSTTRGSELLLTFRAYGTINNKKNYVKILEFNVDGVVYTDLTGETKEEDGSRIQVFRCRMQNGELPSSITVVAIDSKGRRSEKKELRF